MMNPQTLLTSVLNGERAPTPPIWLMRQAGRYLPEYRELRTKARDFLTFCYTPDMATEATLQPINRFGFDAAIIFSDILVLPHALGQKVWFEPGIGPKLDAILTPEDVDKLRLERVNNFLSPVYDAVKQTREALPREKALIGFAGAPWTLAAYMIEGAGSRDYGKARKFAIEHPEAFSRLIELLEAAISQHLINQIEAGAEAVQIFDSWAGALPAYGVEAWSLAPIGRIAATVKAAHPNAKVIVFPRGADTFIGSFSALPSIDAVSLGHSLQVSAFEQVRSAGATPQGNLDPVTLICGGEVLQREVELILETNRNAAFVFNLGHGITPETPIANVETLISIVRGLR
jgi:uroporphyrinogen decarboxylase